MKDFLAGLNEPQKLAVTTVKGPVLILAGAGSGKTKALTHRVAHLVATHKVAPDNILAVTFTNKAATEMRERVLTLLGQHSENKRYLPYMGTFHAVCVRILRQESKLIGLPQSFQIFDDTDSLAVVRQVARSLGLDEKQAAPRLIASLISSAKTELITPDQYQRLASGPVQHIAAKVYPLYQKMLREASALDFDDLITQSVLLFRAHPEALKRWQKQFAYILIDEYQDTNHAQYRLVKLLADAHRNLCVVGDDWQSIYSWRGANFQNILDFEKDYPEAKVIMLEENYRSTKNILDAAHGVISKNRKRSEKKLWTKAGAGPMVTVTEVYNEIAEGELVVHSIRRLLAEGVKLKNIAVLYRVGAQSRALEEAFLRHGMAYKVVGAVRFYDRKEIKDVLAYLRFVYQPQDAISLARILSAPPRGVGEKSWHLLRESTGVGKTLLDAMKSAPSIPKFNPKAARNLAELAGMIESWRKDITRLSVSELIELVVKKSGYLAYLDDPSTPLKSGGISAQDRLENVQELISVAANFGKGDLENFLEEVALISGLDNYSSDTEAVTLMTAHAAKGLEFDCVIMSGMEDGVFPHSRSLYDEIEMEEERRLCYVGMTRAKHQLFLIHAITRMLYGSPQHNPPSRFLLDIPKEVLGAGSSSQLTDTADLGSDILIQEDLAEGDRIRHTSFGEGIVVSVDEDEIVAAFAGVGSKRLSLSFAPIEKL